MRWSGTGALVGAVAGALLRGLVVMLNLGAEAPVMFAIPSAAIGVLVGIIAGATGQPLRGALVGAVLSAVVFELVMMPCFALAGLLDEINADLSTSRLFLRSLLYAAEMGVAGALAGGLGGWAGRRRAALTGTGNTASGISEEL